MLTTSIKQVERNIENRGGCGQTQIRAGEADLGMSLGVAARRQ